jgi:hypothetical protein
MGTKFKKTRKTFLLCVLLTFLLIPSTLWGKGGYSISFLGVNLKTFQGSNWMMIAAGAAASILTHELGHALYLECQGKDWHLETSSSGFAVTTTNSLTDKQYRGLGRSGYLLQAGIGFLLTSFNVTAKSDFTKGWVGMNMVQSLTHKWRDHNGYDDFAMIDRGQGNGESSFRLFSSVSIYNFLKANSESVKVIFAAKGFQDKKSPMRNEDLDLRFNDEASSLIPSLETNITPPLSYDFSTQNIRQLPKIGEGQDLAFLR